MADPLSSPTDERLRSIEQRLQALSERVAELERSVGQSGEHPVDRSTVRSKVTYDWQA